jgi:hypothetical protein
MGSSNGVFSMQSKSVVKIVLVAMFAATALSPALAAPHYTRMPKPCAKPELRCFADCGKDHWCKVYACSANQTVVLPVPCNETSGCLAPHC